MCTCSITKGKNLPLKGTQRRGSITHSSEGEGSLNPRAFPWVASQSQGTVPGCRPTARPEGWPGLALRRVRFCPSQVWAASFQRAEGERVARQAKGQRQRDQTLSGCGAPIFTQSLAKPCLCQGGDICSVGGLCPRAVISVLLPWTLNQTETETLKIQWIT